MQFLDTTLKQNDRQRTNLAKKNHWAKKRRCVENGWVMNLVGFKLKQQQKARDKFYSSTYFQDPKNHFDQEGFEFKFGHNCSMAVDGSARIEERLRTNPI